MAIRIVHRAVLVGGGSIIGLEMSCYDTIGDPEFAFDWDELLQTRSCLEFARDQLTDAQRAELDQIDAFWRANAQDFNKAFATLHYQKRSKTALDGWAWDENGNTPAIPRAHWWWWPIDEGGEERGPR